MRPGVEIGDTVTVIGGGPIGLMFVQVAKAMGCNVISVVKRDSQVAAAKRMGAHEVVQITKVKDPVEAVRMISPEKRGSDVVIEAVGRPEAWEWAIDMVRKGGTVNFFRRMRQRNQSPAGYQPPALFRNDFKSYVPSHAGNRAQGVCSDRGKENPLDRLHYRRSAAFPVAAGPPPHAESQWRYQDRHYSWPLSRPGKRSRDLSLSCSGWNLADVAGGVLRFLLPLFGAGLIRWPPGTKLTHVIHCQQRFPERARFAQSGGLEQTSGGICNSRATAFASQRLRNIAGVWPVSHYENFSVASWFLPERLRQHFFNVYAYCRISDDLGDEVGDPQASLQLLDEWEAELDACYAGIRGILYLLP